jgi:hypothetical protein
MVQTETPNHKLGVALNFILNTVGLLTIIPLAPLINRIVPPVMILDYNADLLISVLLSFGFVRFIFWLFKPLIVPSFIMICLIMAFNLLSGTYSIHSMMTDYSNMVRRNWQNRDEKKKELYLVKGDLFDTEVEKSVKALRSKIDYKDSLVRNFAVRHSLDDFDSSYHKYGYYVRFLSLFKYINGNFKYVPDAQRDEYYATPRETIENGMGGDCEDHTLLMVSAMRAIGARCRMVLTMDHVYPELYCEDQKAFNKVQDAIISLFPEQDLTGIYYREEKGAYWINLDYTATHPGGPYVNDKAYAVIDF